MAKRKRRRRATRLVNFDTLPYTLEGRRYVVYLCLKCTKAWKLPDPVEAWRISSLLAHAQTHEIGAILADAANL